VGDDVELLAASGAVLRTLEILTANDPAAALANEPRAALEADLANPDLAELARAELARRGVLSPGALLRADPRFLHRHYAALSTDDKRRFVEAALPLAKRDRADRDRLCDVALREIDPRTILALAPLVALLDPKQRDDARRLENLRVELLSISSRAADNPAGRPPDFSPLVDEVVEWGIHRPDGRSSDDHDERITRHLSAMAKARVAEALLGAVFSSSHSKADDPDGWLLAEATRLAAEAPSPTLLAVLARLDPNAPRVTSEKELVMDAILRVSATVVKAHPAEAQRARSRRAAPRPAHPRQRRGD
jgi:hypothetical protein